MPYAGESILAKEMSLEHLLHLWRKGDPSYEDRIPQVFSYLQGPDISSEYLGEWMMALKNFFISNIGDTQADFDANVKFSELVLEFMEAGMIVILADISSLAISIQSSMRASCGALLAMTCLLLVFKDSKLRNEVVATILDHGAIEAASRVILTSNFYHALFAINFLKQFSTYSCCNQDLTANQVATVINACCAHHLNSSRPAQGETRNPEMSQLMAEFYPIQQSLYRQDHASLYWFKQSGQEAINSGLLLLQQRNIPVSREFSLQILQHQPTLAEKLLTIACEERPWLDSGHETDGMAAQILMQLMMFPPEVVPGYEIAHHHLSKENLEEWKASLQCNEILYSCPQSLEKIMCKQRKLLDEDISMLLWTNSRFSSNTEEMKQMIMTLMENRATVFSACLRFLINFTYLKTPQTLFFLVLLPLAYIACAHTPIIKRSAVPSLEQDVIVLRKDEIQYEMTILCIHQEPRGVALLAHIGSQLLLGPVLLFRALFRLSCGGYGLNQLQTLRSLPQQTPSIQGFPIYLVHVHQIVEPRVMGKLIRMSIHRRVLERRSYGKSLLDDGPSESVPSWQAATAMFTSAAELAMAVSAFGLHGSNVSVPIVQESQISIRCAKHEVVLCLANASEAAGKTGQWDMAKDFAQHAIDICNTIPMEDANEIGLDIALTKSNIRRLETVLRDKSGGDRHCFGISFKPYY